MNPTEEMVLENKSLRNLIHKQKAILQQLQIQKEQLLYEMKDINIENDLEKWVAEDSSDDSQWNIMISTLPVFNRSEGTIEMFNKRRKLGDVDPELEPSKIHLQCTQYCVSSRKQCQGWKPFYEVQKGVNFGTRLITTLGGKIDTPQKSKKRPVKKCGKSTQKLRRSKRLSDEGRNGTQSTNEEHVQNCERNVAEPKIVEIKADLNVTEMSTTDEKTNVKVEDKKPEFKRVKQENSKSSIGLSKRQETYFSNLIRTGVDRSYVEMEYIRLIGEPMKTTVYENLSQFEIKPVFIMDEVFRANEFYNFKFQLKTKILKEVKTKKIKIGDFVTIANELKARAPFCTNPMISNLKFSTSWIQNLLRGMPVKRSNNHFCFSKK